MADEVDEMIVCANPVCRIAETGRCVEGLEISDCPHYGREPEVNEASPDANAEDIDPAILLLPSAATLSLSEASEVLRRGDARVIAVMGPSDAGKTSLIASLYDLFQMGSVAQTEFARSRTLHAFEQTCHDARASSRRGIPHMNRTPIGEVRFYHLELAFQATNGKSLAILLGDRAGEEYRAAADDVSIVSTFAEVSRADTLTVLVDGQRLLDVGARHNVLSDILMLVQGLQDGDGLQRNPRLALVLTKLDAVSESQHRERALRDFEKLREDVVRLFDASIKEIASFQVAASPKTNALPRGTGVPDLLTFWLKAAPALPTLPTATPRSGRAFARLRQIDDLEEPNHG